MCCCPPYYVQVMRRVTLQDILNCNTAFSVPGHISEQTSVNSSSDKCKEQSSKVSTFDLEQNEGSRIDCAQKWLLQTSVTSSSDKCEEQSSKVPTFDKEKNEGSTIDCAQKWLLQSNAHSHKRKGGVGFFGTVANSVKKLKSGLHYCNGKSILPIKHDYGEVHIELCGSLELWNNSICMGERDCLAFVDETASIPCSFRDAKPELLGHPIRLLSWSFLPSSIGKPCLEVHKIKLIGNDNGNTSNICLKDVDRSSLYLIADSQTSFPNTPCKQRQESSMISIVGCVFSISSLFELPCSSCPSKKDDSPAYKSPLRDKACSDNNKKKSSVMAVGFFVELSSSSQQVLVNNSNQCNKRAAYIYFSGSVTAWRPILSCAINHCVHITHLRKKVILVGENKEKYKVFTATRTSLIKFLQPDKQENWSLDLPQEGTKIANAIFPGQYGHRNIGKADGKIGSYVGVVRDILMGGSLLELDKYVWLLMTHQPFSQLYGLRVGATVAARHVHMIKVKSCLEKGILLGACFKSHVMVINFSPLTAPQLMRVNSRSCLTDLIERLPFVWAFWALQLITCFKKKFQGILCDKDILGSNRKEGIVQKTIDSFIKSNVIKKRDVFKEFFSHEEYCDLGKPFPYHFPAQIPPIFNLYKHIALLWQDPESVIWQNSSPGILDLDSIQESSASWWRHRPEAQVKDGTYMRKVIPSQDLGVILLGYLQVSKYSGRLELVDASGAMDVIIPDFQLVSDLGHAYEVRSFHIVIEGLPSTSTSHIREEGLPLAWSSILKGAKVDCEMLSTLHIYAFFHLKDLRHVELPIWKNSNFSEADEGQFNLLKSIEFSVVLLTHKHPLRPKATDTALCFCVEAVVLPFKISIPCPSSKNLELTKVDARGCRRVAFSYLVCRSDLQDMIQRKSESKSKSRSTKQTAGTLYSYLANISNIGPIELAEGHRSRKMLLHFNNQGQQHYYNVLKIGCCYLVHSLDSSSSSITISGGIQPLSLCIETDYTSLASFEEGRITTDALLKIHPDIRDPINSIITWTKASTNLVFSVTEALDGVVVSKTLKDSLDCHLVSLYGIVEHMQSELPLCMPIAASTKRPEIISCTEYPKYSIVLTVQDLHSSQKTKVVCKLNWRNWPVGLGPGAFVSFHRIFAQRNDCEAVYFKGIPSTLIVVHSVAENISGSHKRQLEMCDNGCWHYLKAAAMDDVPSISLTRIGDLLSLQSHGQMRLHCKVICVEKLVFQRQVGLEAMLGGNLQPSFIQFNFDGGLNIQISFASFLIDDGSGVGRCWAAGDRAARLLNLPQPDSSYPDKERFSLVHQLETLIKKYGHITFNSGHHECPIQALDTHQHLTSTEEKVLYDIVERACFAAPLVLVATRVHLDDEFEHGNKLGDVIALSSGRSFQTMKPKRACVLAKQVELTMSYEQCIHDLTLELSSLL